MLELVVEVVSAAVVVVVVVMVVADEEAAPSPLPSPLPLSAVLESEPELIVIEAWPTMLASRFSNLVLVLSVMELKKQTMAVSMGLLTIRMGRTIELTDP